MDVQNFFRALFDFSFSKFVAPKVIGIVYGIIIFFVGLLTLLSMGAGFQGGFGQGLLVLLISPLIAAIWLLFIRIGLESLVAGIKTAENTSKMIEYMKQMQDK